MRMKQDALRLMLVDDEPMVLELLQEKLGVLPYVQVAAAVTTAPAATAYLQENPVDVVMLDIDLDVVNGFDLAQYVRTHSEDTKIIFLTGHAEYALTGYDYQPEDFLVKPVSFQRLEQTLSRIQKQREKKAPASQPLRTGIETENGLEILNVDELLYIEKSGRRIRFVLRDGRIFWSGETMRDVEPVFESYGFFRCHQSFLVSLREIASIRSDLLGRTHTIFLRDGQTSLPLSRNRTAELRQRLQEAGIHILNR